MAVGQRLVAITQRVLVNKKQNLRIRGHMLQSAVLVINLDTHH